MRPQFDVPLSFAGIVAMIIAGGTIVSSLLSDRLTKRFGPGLVTCVSVFTTAVALFGFSVSGSFWMLCVFAIPYGLGAGAVDAALNNYVAVNYASRHMNWLHCFWGVGAAAGPYILSHYLLSGSTWNSGYRAIAIIQLFLTVILFMSLPLWKNQQIKKSNDNDHRKILKLSEILRIKGIKYVLLTFFAYCALESTAGLWASSFLVIRKGADADMAARYASFFYVGITAGRFLSGFVSDKIGNRNMIRAGICVMFMGITAVLLPPKADILCLSGLIVIGLGCAPVYPAIIHSTPSNFGRENSQAIVGVQMASAYTGSTIMPPLFGFIANSIGIGLYPFYLLILAGLMLVMSEKLNRAVSVKI